MKQQNNRLNLFVFLLLFTLISCATAKQKYQKGNYKGAYKKALSKLEKNSSDRAHKRILTLALQEMLDETEEEIQELNTGEIKDLEKAIKLIDKISENVEESIPYTGEKFLQTKTELSTDRETYNKSIAAIYIDEAWIKYMDAKNTDSKIDYKYAFLNFENALEYDPNSAGFQGQMDSSFTLAQRIVHIEADPSFNIMEAWDIHRKFDDVESYSDRFTTIYYKNPEQKAKADCSIDIKFSSLDFRVSNNSRSEYFTEKIVTGYNTVTDTSGNSYEEAIYENVEGQVDIVSERKVGEWEIRTRINGSSKDCEWTTYNFDESLESTIERYELSGDERAIPSRFKNTINEKHDSEDDMSEELIDQLFRRFVSSYF